MKYYVDDAGKPVVGNDLEEEHLTEVPLPAVNQYQRWNGSNWIGSEKTLSERYGSFRVAMLSSLGWQRIKVIAAASTPEFMAAIAYMEENPQMVKYLWNVIINALDSADKPTATEVTEWQGIVADIEIGIDWIGEEEDAYNFDDEGKMF